MNSLSEETLKQYREVVFDCQPETKKNAEARGFKTAECQWRVTKAYRENYDSIEWNQ